ncbi:MAG: MFS transporter [Acidimicrobiales bacterium]
MIVLRLVMNTGSRMMFTFLPELSRGTGIDVERLGRLLSLRDLSGLSAPFVGRTSDRIGTRRVMLAGGLLGALGMLLFTLGSVGVVIGLVCFGLGRIGYLVGMNAWVGHEVAYERRGRATGQIEMTWAGAALVGLPTMGLAIDRLGWRAAPTALILATVPLTALLAKRLPEQSQSTSGPRDRPTLSLSGWMALASFTLLNGAAQLLVFSHGIWLEDTYGFDAAQVGFAIVAVGVAELLASFSSSRLTDRLGKRNSVAFGALVLTVGLAGLAGVGEPPLAAGLGLLVLAFLGFEFGLVSAIPLVAELDPNARAEVIGRSVGLSIVARAAASLLASLLIIDQGFRLLMVLASVLAAVTTALTILAVREPTPTPIPTPR